MGTAAVWRKIEVPEAHPRRLREVGTVLLEPALEFISGRLASGGHVLGEELHFLGHPALDDLIVLVEAHRHRLPVEHLRLHLLLHHAAELLRCRVAPPLRLEQSGQLGEVIERQLNLLRRWRRAAGRLQVVIHGEERGSDEQEMNQGFTHQALHTFVTVAPTTGSSAPPCRQAGRPPGKSLVPWHWDSSEGRRASPAAPDTAAGLPSLTARGNPAPRPSTARPQGPARRIRRSLGAPS